MMRHLRLLLVSAMFMSGALPPSSGLSLQPAVAAEHIRVPADICDWDDYDWRELNDAEKAAWSTLGWTAQLWDSEDGEAWSDGVGWRRLSATEQEAAMSLGYSTDTWGDECE